MSKKEKVLLGVAIATGISTLNAVTSVSADTVTTSTATDNSSVEVVQKQAVVTPEMVENAKNEANQANQDSLVQAEKTNIAKQTLDSANNDVKTATNQLSETKNLVSENTPEKVAKTNQAITDAQATVKEKTEAVQSATNVQNKALTDVRTQEATEATANNNLTNKKAELSIAQEKVAQTQAALTKQQTLLQNPQNAAQNENTIVLSERYKEALEKVHNQAGTYAIADEAAKQVLLEEGAKLTASNQYKANPADDKVTTYDFNNLPTEVVKELSLFASSVINTMNKQLGTPPTVVTTDSVEFAKKVVAGYKADKFNMWTESGHDGLAINKVADSYGLPVSAPVGTKTQNQYYENWAGVNIKKDGVDNVIGVQPRQMTIGQLKETVYNSLKLFMFPTKESSQQEWAHATGITGSGPFRNSDTKVTYVGVDSAIYAEDDTRQLGGVHFIGIADRYLRMNPKNTFNTTEIPQATSANVNDLKAAVETAKVANDAAQANLVKAQSALQSAQKALDLEKGRTNNLRSQLNQAGKNLETAKQELASAKQVLSDLTATKKNLENADSKLQAAQEAYDKALATMIKAQSVYEDESKKLATARHHRDERVAYYNSLKGQVATANVLTQFYTPKATVTTASYKPSVVKYNVNPLGYTKDTTSTYQAALPKTSGENGHLLAVVGMGLLGMAYLGYKKKIVDVSK